MPMFKRGRYTATLIPIFLAIGVMTGLVIYSPTLYLLFCAATGYGGTVRRSLAPVKTAAAANTRTINVLFDANVDDKLPWQFRPEQRRVSVKLGEPQKIYYQAKNLSNETIVGRAAFNVTPSEIAPYFFKIQCFCFTNEKLKPGERAHMPVVFYIDPEAAKDPDAKDIHDVTLSYTFYRQDKLTSGEVGAARDLGAGSARADQTFSTAKSATFENDAPRR